MNTRIKQSGRTAGSAGSIKRIILFIYWPFTGRDCHRFGVIALIENGFSVEVWNFGKFLFPELAKRHVPDPADFQHIREFNSLVDAISAIEQIGSNTFVLMMHALMYHHDAFRICRALSRAGVPYGVFQANDYPDAERKSGVSDFIRRLLRINGPRLATWLLMRCSSKMLGVAPASVVLVNGARPLVWRFPFGPETERLSIHHIDYDVYLQARAEVEFNERIAVFIDGFLPFHPDYTLMERSAPCPPEEYYPRMCELFDLLERRFQCRVVVASHPKAYYEKLPDYFRGRTVCRGQTAALVRQASFVVCHHSTAINYVALFEKPVAFITMDRLDKSFYGKDIDYLASLFEKRPINIDQGMDIDWEREFDVERGVYRSFVHKFIKENGTEDRPFWEVFADYIKRFPPWNDTISAAVVSNFSASSKCRRKV